MVAGSTGARIPPASPNVPAAKVAVVPKDTKESGSVDGEEGVGVAGSSAAGLLSGLPIGTRPRFGPKCGARFVMRVVCERGGSGRARKTPSFNPAHPATFSLEPRGHHTPKVVSPHTCVRPLRLSDCSFLPSKDPSRVPLAGGATAAATAAAPAAAIASESHNAPKQVPQTPKLIPFGSARLVRCRSHLPASDGACTPRSPRLRSCMHP